ncbi:MAG: hypothetical protein AB1Z98_26715 [Nannocystaceae bacterium]
MRLRSCVFAAVMLLPLSCTSNEGADAADGQANEAAASGMETIEIPIRRAPVITVHDAGQQPRQPLRIRVAAGMEEDLEMSVGMRMGMVSGAQEIPSVPVPLTKTRLHAKVESVDDTGFQVRQSVTSVDVEAVEGSPPEVVDKVRESIAPLTSYTALMRMSDRGSVLGGQVEIPRDLPAVVHNTMQQMTQNLGQIAVPMPEPEVGVGARWTAVNEVPQNGMKLRQTADYTMISRQGDDAVLEVSIVQELVDPEISVPGMMGAKARVSNFSSSGTGTVQLDLAHIAPRSMTMSMDLAMTMDITVMGQHQHMEMDMDIEMKIGLVDG